MKGGVFMSYDSKIKQSTITNFSNQFGCGGCAAHCDLVCATTCAVGCGGGCAITCESTCGRTCASTCAQGPGPYASNNKY